MSNKKASEKAKEWAIDYKSFDDNLRPQDYAEYGYEKGYEMANQETASLKERMKELEESFEEIGNMSNSMAETISDLTNENTSLKERVRNQQLSAKDYLSEIQWRANHALKHTGVDDEKLKMLLSEIASISDKGYKMFELLTNNQQSDG